MSAQVADSVKNLVASRANDLHNLSVRWFGGEPLLEPDRILDITSFAQSLCEENRIDFWSSITTNGFLLEFPLFERLLSSGIRRFQVSLDGMEAEHNVTRRSGTPGGSFSTIMTNLLEMRRSLLDFQVILRIHIHGSNLESVCDLIDHIVENFGNDKRFKILLEKIKTYSTGHTNPLKLVSDSSMQIARKHLKDRMNGSIAFDLSDVHCCYAALPNHFVIRSNGNVHKCTVALYDERNDIGVLKPDGTFVWDDHEKLAGWAHGLLEGNIVKAQCPLKALNTASD